MISIAFDRANFKALGKFLLVIDQRLRERVTVVAEKILKPADEGNGTIACNRILLEPLAIVPSLAVAHALLFDATDLADMLQRKARTGETMETAFALNGCDVDVVAKALAQDLGNVAGEIPAHIASFCEDVIAIVALGCDNEFAAFAGNAQCEVKSLRSLRILRDLVSPQNHVVA